eukprot:7608581-Pyramimonas_sp.AAC.1
MKMRFAISGFVLNGFQPEKVLYCTVLLYRTTNFLEGKSRVYPVARTNEITNDGAKIISVV